ncbi:MAG: hypothetical protein QOK05_1605 [Chloroflexota bacterium]|nr:hypothetical protein [Chloroflexota bacterium]
MKYLYLLYADESQAPAPGSPEMLQQLEGYNAFFKEVNDKDLVRAGDPVQGSATSTTVRARNGGVEQTPGPFGKGAEQIIGFYVLDVASQDEAVQYAAKIPAAKHGAIEVRPILDLN